MSALSRGSLLGSAAACALLAAAGSALAGGFAIREQSAEFQGLSFAGNAAGGAISSMFWNPAALGLMGGGLQTESAYSLVMTDAEFTATSATVGLTELLTLPGNDAQTNTGRMALVAASYYGYRLSPDMAIGISITAPLGLGSEPDTDAWAGRLINRSAKITTYNATPTMSYRLAPGLFIGAGVQLEYAKLVFKFGDQLSITNPNGPNAGLDVDDGLGVGYTIGLLWQPLPGTSVGLGFRSSIEHDLEGVVFDNGIPSNFVDVKAQVDTPETVTLSLRQVLAPNIRGLATIEWSNWSRFDSIPFVRTSTGSGDFAGSIGSNFAVLDLNWHDGWFYSVGLEWDVMQSLTLRTGLAFEQSPVQNATERIPQVPDSDRIWLSGGLSYALMSNITVDFAYTHIFAEDADIDRGSLTSPTLVRLVAEREASIDIVTVGVKSKW
jgi:long-chain fatty acid transport protein